MIDVDLLIVHGRVVTVDPDDTVFDDGGVAVAGGRIVAVGPASEITRTHRSDDVVDASGAFVLPGLVNAHTHLAMTLFRGVADDVDLQGFLARVWEHEAAVVSADTVELGVTAGVAESLLGGVTTAADMYFHQDVAVAVAERIGFRLVTGPSLYDFPGAPAGNFERLADEAESWLRSFSPRLGLRPVVCPHSTYTLDRRQLEVVRELAGAHGALVHVHAAENRGEMVQVAGLHAGATPVQVLDELGLLTADTLLAHAVHLDDADLRRVADAGAAVAHCPASNLKLASGIARVPDLVDAGVPVGLGSDGAASSNDLDLWIAMRLAGLLQKGVTGDPTVLPAAQVVRLATIGGASALGVDDEIGSLETGKRADVVMLDTGAIHLGPVHHAYGVLAYAAGRGDVTDVWVEGRRVVDRRQVVGVDVPRVAARIQEVATAPGA